MKKFFVFFILSVLTTAVFAQKSVNVEHSQQYETFSWQKVENAKKYLVEIEKLESDGSWKKVLSKQTAQTQYKAPLEEGTYRLAISTYNILGKKAATSEWTEFKVVDSSVPYLFEKSLRKSKKWNVPVLYADLKKGGGADSTSSSSSTNSSTNSDSDDYIELVKDKKNTFFIKGKNILTSETRFFLKPVERSKKGGEYKSFYSSRAEVPLSVVSRDDKKSGVYVSFDAEKLYSGYYQLEARKNGITGSPIEMLVLVDRPLEIKPVDFKIDTRYKVNTIELTDEANIEFTVEGTGFSSQTNFYLDPAEGTIPYTFSTSLEREKIILDGYSKTGEGKNGKIELKFACPSSELKSGYYNVVASNSNNDSARFLILAKPPIPKSSEDLLKKFSSKYNKRTKNVEFSIGKESPPANTGFTIISEFQTSSGEQVRMPLNFIHDPVNSKYTAYVPADLLPFGDYMLLAESKDSSFTKYFTLNNRYVLHNKKFSDDEIAKKFLPHENDIENISVTLDTQEAGTVNFESKNINVYSRYPKIVPFLRLTAGADKNFFGGDSVPTYSLAYTKSQGEDVSEIHSDLRAELDVINILWFALGAALKYNPNAVDNDIYPDLAPEVTAKFLVNWAYFKPYIGLGVGYNILQCDKSSAFYAGDHDLYAYGYAGCTLVELYEMSYHFEVHNRQLHPLDFKDDVRHVFNFGIRIPLRPIYYEQEILSRKAVVDKNGAVLASEFEGLNAKNVDAIQFAFGVTSIGGFEGYKNITAVTIPSTLQEIQRNAFKDCANLGIVTIPETSDLEIIRSGAFENTTAIRSLTLPGSIKIIEKDAFKGWSNGQSIYLPFTKTEADNLQLDGIKDSQCFINYKDDEVSIQLDNPFEDYRNFRSFNGNIYLLSTFYSAKDDKYRPALHVKGLGVRGDAKKESDAIPDIPSPSVLIDYFKKGNRISFKVNGEGKKYLLFVTTKDGGAFYQEFSTKKNREKNITLYYDDFKKTSYSKEKRFNKNNVTAVKIVPVFDGTLSDSEFYGFKVD